MSTAEARSTSDPAEFQATVFPFLQRDPLLNTSMLTNIAGRANGIMVDPEPPVFVSVHDGGDVVGVVIATALRGILLTQLPSAMIPGTAAALAELAPAAKSVEAPTELARRFAAEYAARVGKEATADRATRLHELGELVPQYADGMARQATPDDLDVVARFVAGFGDDTGGRLGPEEEHRWARTRTGLGQLWLWENGGRVVSMVGHHGAAFGIDRIGPVYTPPAERGHGYASALTAYVSKLIVDQGAGVCLFTDLANPTSNKIYATIGYRPVADFQRYAVGPVKASS